MVASSDSEKIRELFASGALAAAGDLLKQRIRANPNDAQLRIVYFQWLALNWEWDKARTQLDVIEGLDAESVLFAQTYRPLIDAEVERASVLAGKATPTIFGEPDESVAQRVEALRILSQQEAEGAQLLQALEEELPALECVVNGQSCPWLADGDTRFGANLEGAVNGRYIWIPIDRISQLKISAPATGCDLIWAPTEFTWKNGGVVNGFLFARYPGAERPSDPALLLSRRTEWVELAGSGVFKGLGQRMLFTEDCEFPILDVRNISFTQE